MNRHGVTAASSDRSGGQALVEFALVFPVLVFVLLGIFDVGRAVYAYNTIANAAREGARIAAVNQLNPAPSDTTCIENMPVENLTSPNWSIKACAASSAVSLGVLPSAVSVSYSPPPNTGLSCSPTLYVGCIASVTVSYTWSPVTPVISNLLGHIAMTSTSQIPIERVFP